MFQNCEEVENDRNKILQRNPKAFVMFQFLTLSAALLEHIFLIVL